MSAYYNEVDIYIFFLRLDDALPEDYFHLANYFKQYCISLIPVTAKQLVEMSTSNREYVLSLNTNLTSDSIFKRFQKKFLNFSLLSRKFYLFDLSSFSKIEIAPKAEYAKSYKHYPLPVDLEDTVIDIALAIYEDREKKQIWPGGRRAKLPPLA
jgi:hypothetical protein